MRGALGEAVRRWGCGWKVGMELKGGDGGGR